MSNVSASLPQANTHDELQIPQVAGDWLAIAGMRPVSNSAEGHLRATHLGTRTCCCGQVFPKSKMKARCFLIAISYRLKKPVLTSQ